MQDDFTMLWLSFGAVYVVILLIAVAFAVLVNWRIFSKAYVPGWHSLIPFLSTYRFLQIAGMNPNLMFLMFIPCVGPIIVMVLLIIARYKLVLMFGGSSGLAVASIFVSGIVMLILAFSPKYDYVGVE